MTPQQYCVDKAAPEGSHFYYSVVFETPAVRQSLTALAALARELREVVEECRDATTATTKLNWWGDEIERFLRLEPRHPVTTALRDCAHAKTVDAQVLGSLLQGTAEELGMDGAQTADDLERMCRRTAGTLARTTYAICLDDSEGGGDACERLGTEIELIQRLLDVRRPRFGGAVPVAINALTEFSLTPEDLLATSPSPALRALVEAKITRARERINSVDENGLCAPLRFAARLTLLDLKRVERNAYELPNGRLDLMPLRKLFIAWRAQRVSSGRR